MEPFKVYILGCGSALPTIKHFASSQVVQMRGKEFMIDCGEGTQIQLRRSRQHFNKILAVFISHCHGDHCLGLMGMISTFGMLGRTAPLHVYAPAEFEDIFKANLEFFCSNMEYEVVFHAIDTAKREVIYNDKSLTVETLPLQHRVPCCGFLFKEKATLPHIRRDMIDFLGIPLSQINNIKNGASWTTEEGKVYTSQQLTEPADAPRSYAYCSDTKFVPDLAKEIENVSLLYHESTYASDYEDRAKLYYHSTAEQAATIAKRANAGQLILGHFSARYNNEELLLDEAKKIFPNSILARENLVVDIK
ncbi:MAG: ribonuclease Z [Prevotella sp.]|nr:ribonuclease Z [Prevotella sp.]